MSYVELRGAEGRQTPIGMYKPHLQKKCNRWFVTGRLDGPDAVAALQWAVSRSDGRPGLSTTATDDGLIVSFRHAYS